MAKVFHANQPNFGMAIGDPQLWPEDFTLVAETKTNNLEQIFELTNSIDSPWWENAGVEAVVKPCRSTSVGDIVLTDDGKLWYCDIVGWKPLKVRIPQAQDDAKKLRLLADWFDEEQKTGRWSGSDDVQKDLRRIADTL